VDQSVRLDFALKPGAVTETIEVSARPRYWIQETTSVGQVVSNKAIVEMPLNGRNYLNLATLAAGTSPSVAAAPHPKGASSPARAQLSDEHHGGRPGQQHELLGGPVGFRGPGREAIHRRGGEFKVVTNNLSAEYGSRMGGTVLVTIKSGTNQFHAQLTSFLRNDKARRRQLLRQPERRPQARVPSESVRRRSRRTHPKKQDFLFGSFDGTEFAPAPVRSTRCRRPPSATETF